jgi:hypothetical protein
MAGEPELAVAVKVTAAPPAATVGAAGATPIDGVDAGGLSFEEHPTPARSVARVRASRLRARM